MNQQSKEEYVRAVRLLPPSLRNAALELPGEILERAEEFRLRVGRPASLVYLGREAIIDPSHILSEPELQIMLEIATRSSAQSYQDSIRSGYVTAEGGCRVGLCGTVAVDSAGKVSAMRRFSSLCVRIPREKRGCADNLMSMLTEPEFCSTLIISPPGGGKTTLLREVTRRLSDGGMRISVCDERSEIAGVWEGKPCFDLGAKSDVLNGAPKEEGILMLLRTMSPQIIAFDEITTPGDIAAAERAANCGVKLLATAHCGGLEELSQRELYKGMLEKRIFRRAVIIRNEWGRRSYICREL